MEINFATTGTTAEAVPITEHAPSAAVARPLSFEDRVPGLSEIILPRINLVQYVGLLKDSFQPGAIVYNQAQVLYTPPVINARTTTIEKQGTAPLIITALNFRPTQFVEKVAGGGRGLLCNSEEEVRAAGGTLDYKEFKLKEKDGMKRFEYLATALVAIERPEIAADDDTIFVYEVNGKKYALALWGLKGTAYTSAAKSAFFTARKMGCLRGGYPTHSFATTAKLKATPDGKNTYFVPICLPNQKSTSEFLAWADSVLNTPTVEVPEDHD